MKKLVMSALLIGAVSQAAGCIFVSDDDSSSGTNSVSATWEILDDGAPAACPTGATTATVYAQRPSDSTPFADIFNCSDGAGVAADLPDGDYTVWVEITDDSGATLFAMSEDASVTLTAGENIDADFQIDGYNGFWDVSWNILDAGGADVGCAGFPANGGVSVLSTQAGTTEATDDVFNCTDGEAPAVATTGALPLADYVVVVSLLDQAQAAIGESNPINASFAYGNEFQLLNDGPIDVQEGHFN